MTRLPKLFTTTIFFISFLSISYAQSDKQRIDAYINQYKSLAIEEMQRTGVPASITLAQGILETAGGQSDLASVANNHFGIKCKSDWNGDYMLHDDDAKNERFRKYATVEDSYKDHSDFLKARPGYAFLFKLDPTDYEGWAKGLKKAGYATNPNYAQSIIKMIVENNLQDYSMLALKQSDNSELETTVDTNTASVESTQPIEMVSNAEPTTNQKPIVMSASTMQVMSKAEMKKKVKAQQYPLNTLFTINEAKVIYAT